MMQHRRPAPNDDPAHRSQHPEQAGRFELRFGRHGDRTRIGRQFVSYPFHFTRPFLLDPEIPSLLTVYQQSSSGGLYRNDLLTTELSVGDGAAAHVTTQAATVVHDCHGAPARQRTKINVGDGGFLAYTPDPLILFPNASVTSEIDVRMVRSAVVLEQESFTWHDPRDCASMFDTIRSDIRVFGPDEALIVRDRFEIEGASLSGDASPACAWRLVATHLILGDILRMPAQDALIAASECDDAVAGISALPNQAGWCVRSLAANANAARRISENIFSACIMAAFGAMPAPRRK